MSGITFSGPVINYKGTPGIWEDVIANRPAFGVQGRIFIGTDNLLGYRDTGTAWVELWPSVGSGVTSFNSRTGAVVPQAGDYTTTIVAEGTNLYFTNARARAAFSGSTNISISAGGVISVVDPLQVNTIQAVGVGTHGQITLNDQVMRDNSGIEAIAWGARQMIDSSNFTSIVWGTRKLTDASGNASVLWNLYQLVTVTGPTNVKLSWGTANLVDIPATNNLQVQGTTGSTLKFANSTTAPGTTATPTFTSYYGGNTKALGDPAGWALVNLAGTERKIPFY